MRRNIFIRLLGIVLFLCFSFIACKKEAAPPLVSYEISREARTNRSGRETAYAEFPVFTCSSDGYDALSAALDAVNKEWQQRSKTFLDNAENLNTDPLFVFSQSADVTITQCDTNTVCILVAASLEEGGPHPNNYFTTYNFNAKTGEILKLSDVITVDETLKETIKNQLYKNYPELEFDHALLEQEISNALNHNLTEWYLLENQISIGFPEGSFGFSHAEGSLGVLLPLE